MTFVELLVVMVVLTVAVTMFTSMVVHTSRQRGVNRENAIASNAARSQLERMRSRPFRDLFALYNGDPSDDPGGEGTAPGNAFAVEGLTPLADDPDGLVGEIILPVILEDEPRESSDWGSASLTGSSLDGVEDLGEGSQSGAYHTLREDYEYARLGMPRDLNGDSLVDDLDHAGDYIVLPVCVRVEWRGYFGPREHNLYSQIALFAEVD